MAKTTSLHRLSRKDRRLLMKFVCSFAWMDHHVTPEERALVADLIRHLGLDESESKQVGEWLEVPPSLDAVDPTLVPRKHRKIFLESLREIVMADREISREERDCLEIFGQLMA